MTWQDDMLAQAQETNRWLRVLALPALREKLRAELDKPELRRLYQESDGRSTRDVASALEVGHATVQRHWQQWAAEGLLEPAGVSGRFRRIIDLREVGMEG